MSTNVSKIKLHMHKIMSLNEVEVRQGFNVGYWSAFEGSFPEEEVAKMEQEAWADYAHDAGYDKELKP